jgi:O-antigen ligase
MAAGASDANTNLIRARSERDSVRSYSASLGLGIKMMLAIYFFICFFFNFVIREDVYLTVANLAEIALIVVAIGVWLQKPVVRKWRGTRTERKIAILLVTYMFVRLLLSYGSPLFVRHSVKLILLLLLIIAYHLLGMERRLLPYVAWLLPSLYALAIGIRLFELSLSGELGSGRLQMPPYTHEYVGIMASFTTGLLIYAWLSCKRVEQRIGLSVVTALWMLGLFLSASRNALLTALVTLTIYVLVSGQRFRRTILILVTVALLVFGFSWVYQLETVGDASRLDIMEYDPTLTGRTIIWLDAVQQLTSSTKAFVFGFGVGGFAADIPEISSIGDSGWDSIKQDPFDGFLSAWANFGLIGLFGYGFLWFSLLRRIWQIRPPRHRALILGMFLAVFLSDLFDTRWQQTRTNWLFAYSMCLFAFSTDEPTSLGTVRRPKTVQRTEPLE